MKKRYINSPLNYMSECKNCNQNFQITDQDREFYRKIDVPDPTLCPDCRQQRRLVFRNERSLYSDKCSCCGKNIITMYGAGHQFPVYCYDCWWGDKMDGLAYGVDFDFSKQFFPQFLELKNKVPRIYLYNRSSENSEYTNHAAFNKSCYMTFNAAYNEDCFYSTNLVIHSHLCVDCHTIDYCELCHNCFMCERCYGCRDLVLSNDCNDSHFCYDCNGCHNCLFCYNLRNAEYMIGNKKYSPENYQQELAKLNLNTQTGYQQAQDRFRQIMAQEAIHKFALFYKSDKCTGDYIFNSHNVKDTFYAQACENVCYCYDAHGNKECYDTYESSIDCQQQYECEASNWTNFSKFCNLCQECYNLDYCDYCFNCHDCFACVGLKKQEFCILNKKYSEAEYKKIRSKLIEYLKQTGEWGEFFPLVSSPFTYNESVAMDFYPLTKEQCQAKGYFWRDPDPREYQKTSYQVPNDIKEVKDDILDVVLSCQHCGRNFKLQKTELDVYRQQNIPVPIACFNCRYKERITLRHSRQLYNRQCVKCNKAVQTTYAPDRPEKIYCAECYQKEIY